MRVFFFYCLSAESLPTSDTYAKITKAFPGHILPTFSGQGDVLANLCARANLWIHQLEKILLMNSKGSVSITGHFIFPVVKVISAE